MSDRRTRPPDQPAKPPGEFKLPAALANHPRYRVLQLLGAGGMGAVYKAEHRTMGRRVALKVIAKGLVGNPDAAERFDREVKAAAQLAHPNIVTAYDAEQAGDLHFLVMEYVEGRSLAQVLDEQGPLPVAQACACIAQAALGLQHAAEKGMVHRDIKPHNLMLTPDGQVKILDFGLARLAREAAPAALTQSGAVMGTPDYLAPEQAQDAHAADIRADVYSLGCTLYQLLSGRVPFPGHSLALKLVAHQLHRPEPLTGLRPEVPPALAAVVERMMAKDPAQRYPTPADVARALAPFLGGAAGGPPPAPHSRGRPARTATPGPGAAPTQAPAAGEETAWAAITAPRGSARRVPRRRSVAGWLAAAGVLLAVGVLGVGAYWLFPRSASGPVMREPEPPDAEPPAPRPGASSAEAPRPGADVLASLQPGGLDGRRGPARQELLRRCGGTPESEAAVARGLRWLVAQQRADGSWSLRGYQPEIDAAYRSEALDLAATALALLPLLGSGETQQAGAFTGPIRRGLAYLLAKQGVQGQFGEAPGKAAIFGSMYVHGLATLAVCEAYALTKDPTLRDPAQAALDFTVRAQHPTRGWGYQPGQAGDTSITGWQFQGLQTGRRAGLRVPEETWSRTSTFLDLVAAADDSGYGYKDRKVSPSCTAVALLCRLYQGRSPRGPAFRKAVETIRAHLPQAAGSAYYAYYYYSATSAMVNVAAGTGGLPGYAAGDRR